MHETTGPGDRLLQLEQVVVEASQRLIFESRASRPQFLPVRHLLDHPGAFGADRQRRLGQVAPELRISERRLCGGGEGG